MLLFVSYLRHVLCKTRLIFPRINGPNVFMTMCVIVINTIFVSADPNPWPGVAIFLQNALIFFRQVIVLVKPKLTLKGN